MRPDNNKPDNNKQLAITTLLEGGYSIVVMNKEEQFTSNKRGIAPILELLDTNKDFLKGAIVADKVIGKAAALLLIAGGIKELYAHIISEHAIKVLNQQNIPYDYKEKVPYIINRTQTGMCPMESQVLCLEDANEAVYVLKAALVELQQSPQA
jgi:hypothetical protein